MRGWFFPNHPGQNKWNLFSKAKALGVDVVWELGWAPSELAVVELVLEDLAEVAAEGAVLTEAVYCFATNSSISASVRFSVQAHLALESLHLIRLITH